MVLQSNVFLPENLFILNINTLGVQKYRNQSENNNKTSLTILQDAIISSNNQTPLLHAPAPSISSLPNILHPYYHHIASVARRR